MPDINGMQANFGLSGAAMGPVGIPTPSPADVALRLSMESASRQQQAFQTISSVPLGAPSEFRAQFERQMSTIQAQQSLNPYAAQMMAQSMPSQQQQYLPSPLTMTPPSTGVFRPPPPPAAAAPLPPVYTPQNQYSPFTPQAPPPMFSSPFEQQIQQQEIRSNRGFAQRSQIPSALGYGAGIMAGAAAGAGVGARFGGWGGAIGAGVGAMAAGASGIAEGLGNMGQRLMQPAIERRQMGAGLQNMSRNWVVSGSDVSPLGRGLSQNSSNELAGQIQNLAGESSFQQQTGGAFNRKDLMKITRQGGEQGLFDMTQEVPQIKQQLRQTATTIKQFMELTNDPDITNVIRQMGRMRQFGMTQQDMTTAAQGLKTFSRATGTSQEGLQQIGGLPGAATFQQAGLTAGQGFQYGNFAAASARQMVASGGVSPRQLALMGGVQGMAQRDMQGQAAMGSMPLYAASNAQYGRRGWGMDTAGQKSAEGGAFGMVQGALKTMNQAVQRGGVGALASFPLQQREIADKAMAEMTPQEQMAQRFKMAMSTGQRLGLKGEEAFSTGSRLAYGDDVASQMLTQAKSPKFWKAQRQMLRQRKKELGQETLQRAEQNAPMLGGLPRDAARGMGLTGRGSWGEDVGEFFGGIGEGFGEAGKAVSGLFGGIGDEWDDYQAKSSGVIRTQTRKGSRAVMRGGPSTMGAALESTGRTPLTGGDGGSVSAMALANAANLQDQGTTGMGAQIADYATAPLRTMLGVGKIGGAAAWLGANATMDQQEQRQAVKKYVSTGSRALEILDESRRVGGKKPETIDAMQSLKDVLGKDTSSMSILNEAANILDKEVYTRGEYGAVLGEEDYERAVVEGISKTQGISKGEAKKKVAQLKKSGALSNITSQVVHRARTDSRDPEIWAKTQEADPRRAIREQVASATEARQGNLAGAAEGLEDKMDIDSFLGSYSDAEDKVQGLAGKYGGKGLALRVAMAESGTGDMDDRTSKKLRDLEKGFSEEELLGIETEMKGMDEDTRDLLKKMGREGTTEDIKKYGSLKHAEKMQGVWGSAGFMESVGKYSSGLEAMIADPEAKELSAKGISGTFTDDELKKMARQGGAGGRRLAQIIKKTKAGDKKAGALLEKYAEEQAVVSKEGVEETAEVKGEGKESQRLEAADAAMSDMQKVFAGFGSASKDFAYGAKAFAEAMDSDTFNKQQE